MAFASSFFYVIIALYCIVTLQKQHCRSAALVEMDNLVVIFIAVLLSCSVSAQSTSANFCTGIDIDGTADDWDSCASPEVTMDMRQVGRPGSDVLSNALRVRFAYDDVNIFVLATIRGRYFFNLTAGNGFSHSVSVMWKIGADSTMQNMGGCSIPVDDDTDCAQVRSFCTSEQCNCEAHLVDIWHMETGSPGALPGVQYPWRGPIVFPSEADGTYQSFAYAPTAVGSYQPAVERLFNGNDHTSNTDDEFAVHSCLRSDDGSSSNYVSNFRLAGTQYGNQIKYAWSHSTIDSYRYPFGTMGAEGDYTYEFSRPLSTKENTDAKFCRGETASFAFAFWIPPEFGVEWEDANHYVSPSSFQFGTVTLSDNGTAAVVANIISLVAAAILATLI